MTPEQIYKKSKKNDLTKKEKDILVTDGDCMAKYLIDLLDKQGQKYVRDSNFEDVALHSNNATKYVIKYMQTFKSNYVRIKEFEDCCNIEKYVEEYIKMKGESYQQDPAFEAKHYHPEELQSLVLKTLGTKYIRNLSIENKMTFNQYINYMKDYQQIFGYYVHNPYLKDDFTNESWKLKTFISSFPKLHLQNFEELSKNLTFYKSLINTRLLIGSFDIYINNSKVSKFVEYLIKDTDFMDIEFEAHCLNIPKDLLTKFYEKHYD